MLNFLAWCCTAIAVFGTAGLYINMKEEELESKELERDSQNNKLI